MLRLVVSLQPLSRAKGGIDRETIVGIIYSKSSKFIITRVFLEMV
jgi:hypothetical protein